MSVQAVSPVAPTPRAMAESASTTKPPTSGHGPPYLSNNRPAIGPARMIGIVPGMSASPAVIGPTPTTSSR